jgi:hypothetical protein
MKSVCIIKNWKVGIGLYLLREKFEVARKKIGKLAKGRIICMNLFLEFEIFLCKIQALIKYGMHKESL